MLTLVSKRLAHQENIAKHKYQKYAYNLINTCFEHYKIIHFPLINITIKCKQKYL